MTHPPLELGEWGAGLGSPIPTLDAEVSGIKSKFSPKPASDKIFLGNVAGSEERFQGNPSKGYPFSILVMAAKAPFHLHPRVDVFSASLG